MPKLVGFSRLAALLEEQISDKILIVWWTIGAGVHVESQSHANEQIVWMQIGKHPLSDAGIFPRTLITMSSD